MDCFSSETKMPGYFQNRKSGLNSLDGLLLVGHRGHRLRRFHHRTTEVENTLAAFRRAWKSGCGGLELDIRPSLDGCLVVHHDAWLRTPHGRWDIASTPWPALRRRDPALTTLPAVLRHFSHLCWLDIEVKAEGAEETLLAALRRQPPRRGFVLSSFDPTILRRLRRLDRSLPLCWNLAATGALRWPRLRLACVAVNERRVTDAFLRACRRRHLPALAWTVNRPARMRQLAALGVAGILSDHPPLLVKTLRPGYARAGTRRLD